jgi:hypothetical protein
LSPAEQALAREAYAHALRLTFWFGLGGAVCVLIAAFVVSQTSMEPSCLPFTSLRSPTTDCRTMIRSERRSDHVRLGTAYRQIDLPIEVDRSVMLRRECISFSYEYS